MSDISLPDVFKWNVVFELSTGLQKSYQVKSREKIYFPMR